MLRANVDGTLAVMRAALTAGVERVVHCSSVAALAASSDGTPFDETTPTNDQAGQRNRAAQAGYDRGTSDGRQAGRESHANGRGWDPDGQAELERADSGYYPQAGTLGDYQTGYRDGFRLGYREGFGQR